MQTLLLLLLPGRQMSKYVEIVPLTLQASTIRDLLAIGSHRSSRGLPADRYFKMAMDEAHKLLTIEKRLRTAGAKFTHKVSKGNRHVLIFTNKKDLALYYLLVGCIERN